ncbi:flagellar basal-body rod protein [Babesia caballi]|uniref:Flagellar basal-body rod protein n=1 Tax=Babesia caballi TaxID=5871 RepID=A0AAV4LLW0_BABCB|nr:flagellar basal-body rod protein [Babesia caballi]GIX60823.1 flagellar basal-body rod protein [Babesia caballi]
MPELPRRCNDVFGVCLERYYIALHTLALWFVEFEQGCVVGNGEASSRRSPLHKLRVRLHYIPYSRADVSSGIVYAYPCINGGGREHFVVPPVDLRDHSTLAIGNNVMNFVVQPEDIDVTVRITNGQLASGLRALRVVPESLVPGESHCGDGRSASSDAKQPATLCVPDYDGSRGISRT